MKYFVIILVILGFSSNICFAENYISKTPPTNELIETNMNMGSKEVKNVAGKHEINKDTYRIFYYSKDAGKSQVDSQSYNLFKLDTDIWCLTSPLSGRTSILQK
ncbi:MAG: hypothetical protein L6277_12895 [Desulfobacterales bacterium]|nr:hypothetical protein [Pseudomonadota bacterium]MBU4355597.1 hypothetical protein [Pseudomonadota bacterium]MCG2772971.1 hypothetical protein [Desulfobacterales bacterium]